MVLTLSEIKRYAFVRNIRSGIRRIFLDYVQDKFMFYFAQIYDLSFVWKGGTVLFKYYGSQRFSEDLDLASSKRINLDRVIAMLESEGFEISHSKVRWTGNVIYAKYEVRHPFELLSTSVRINISVFGSIGDYHKIRFISPYPDIPEFDVLVVSPQKILSDKLEALMTRRKPRDLYDIIYILRKYNITVRIPSNKKDVYMEAIKEIGKKWSLLKEYVLVVLPKFSQIKNEFLRRVVWV